MPRLWRGQQTYEVCRNFIKSARAFGAENARRAKRAGSDKRPSVQHKPERFVARQLAAEHLLKLRKGADRAE